ncbi:heavy-metal-associated domain-containing protein [Aminiphilus circumscriptus]|jgi:copper chaperone|uniref:heavy-metal-associated domain-containing protein n=1 Tax=Aminiphilus circumscriptus TaxID=290732 RepID=UPI00047867F3|nr:heavy-metal-associated domain-containing protein [Aminiphilus circumscriptus]
MAHYTLSVPDMSCSHCARRITEALQRIIDEKDFRVLLEEKQVQVNTENLEDVLAALDDAGYTASVVA